MLSLHLFLHLLFVVFVNTERSNVCDSILDYGTRIHCDFNPDVDRDTDVITKSHGYPSETYEVMTDDGYILTMFRLPNNSAEAQTIFIQHGANSDSTIWVDIGNRSLAFYLYDKGYDVWLGNIRGSWYSRGHVNTSILFNYWDFNLDTLAKYDMPAQINFVKNKIVRKNNKKIIYIGHSMGTTLSYMYSMVYKNDAENNVCGFVHFAPVMYFDHTPIGLHLSTPFGNYLAESLAAARAFPITADRPLNQLLYRTLCFQYANTAEFCNNFLDWFVGSNPPQRQARDLPLIFSYFSSGFSSRILAHFFQFINENFRYFDYGPDNIRYYGTVIPPAYDLKKINNRFLLMYGSHDTLSHIEDISNFRKKLSDPEMFEIMEIEKFNHLDFMYAKDIIRLLYERMLPFMQRIQKDHCQ